MDRVIIKINPYLTKVRVLVRYQNLSIQKLQSDWSEQDITKMSYIKNKPTKTSDFENNGSGVGSKYIEEKDIEDLLDIKEYDVELIQDYPIIGTVAGESQKEYNEKNQAIIIALIGNVPHPNYLSPTMTMTEPTTPQKVGASYDVNLTLTYTKRDGGNATTYKIEKNTVEVSTTNTYSELEFIIPIGLTTYKGTINYAQGEVKNNSIGIPDPFGRIPAGALSKTVTIEGVYPLFGTTSSITVGTEQSLVSMINANNVVLNLVGESGGNKQFFDIPQDWLDSRPLTKIEFYDFNTNAWNSQNQLSTFTAVANTHTVNGNVIDYKRYTNNGSNRGSIRMRLIF